MGQFALSFLKTAPIPINIDKEMEEFWCIVALNESALAFTELNATCNLSGKSSAELKLYQLFIGVGSKEIRLQSL